MGCTATKPKDQVFSPVTQRDVIIENKLSPMLNPTHDLNVNKKYSYMIRIIPDQFVGEGIRKTPKYISLISQEKLEAKRIEFWGPINRIQSGRKT